MRNGLTHVYFDLDIDRVWDMVQMDIPELGILLRDVFKNGKSQ